MTTEATRPRATASRTDQSRHGPVAQLLIAWSPLSAILAAYWVAQWVAGPLGTGGAAATNRVGASLHVLGPATADERIFGAVPTLWLQQHLATGSPQWWDAVAALVYVTHFVAIPLVTAVAWFALRHRFREWLVAALTMSVIGIVGYVLYPAAPPWLASQNGDIETVSRISHTGWQVLHLDVVGRVVEVGQSGSNPVAAMPSLHAGAALLVALFLWPSVSRRPAPGLCRTPSSWRSPSSTPGSTTWWTSPLAGSAPPSAGQRPRSRWCLVEGEACSLGPPPDKPAKGWSQTALGGYRAP